MAEKERDMAAVRATFADGMDVDISVTQTLEYMRNSGGAIIRKGALEFTDMGGGLYRIDVHLDAITDGTDFYYPEDTGIPILAGLSLARMQEDEGPDLLDPRMPYFADLSKGNSGDAELWACDPEAMITSREGAWTARHVALTHADPETGEETEPTKDGVYATVNDEDGTKTERTLGELGLDPERLVAFYSEETDRYVTVPDLLAGLSIMAASLGIATQMKEGKSNRPIVLRTGPQVTAAMEASDKRGKYEDGNGGEFVRAPNGTMISAMEIGDLIIDAGTKKTFAWLNHLATTSGQGYKRGQNCVVNTSIGELLEVRKLEDNRRQRTKIRKEIRALGHWRFDWTDPKGNEHSVGLSSSYNIQRGGGITFAITDEFMQAVLNSRAGQLPMNPALMRTDDRRNPHAYIIGYKLSTHTYQNKGEANENTLSVAKLLEHIETLPKPDEIGSRHHTRRIIEPMERDLDALVEEGILEWWDYCHKKGAPLTDEEQAARIGEDGEDVALPYEIAIKANIQWQLANDYEDHMEKVLESRAKRRDAAEAEREKQARRRKRIQDRKDRRVAEKLADKEAQAQTKRGEK